MTDTFLFGRDLERYTKIVRTLAAEVRNQQRRATTLPPLRDTATWEILRQAQRWIACRQPPHHGWQGNRVRRTALQLGYGRSVTDGSYSSLADSIMAYETSTHEVVVLPKQVAKLTVPMAASVLLHESTHLVYREILCERTGFTLDETFVLCNRNEAEQYRTSFTTEALAFWNQTSWLLASSQEDLLNHEQREMLRYAAQMITRSSTGTTNFAEALHRYTISSIEDSQPSSVDLPLVYLDGHRAGSPVVVSDLAPNILEPLLAANLDNGY